VKRAGILLAIALLASGCTWGQAGQAPGPASVSPTASTVSSPSGSTTFLELSSRDPRGIVSHRFTPPAAWDLVYSFDCGKDSKSGANISVVPAGGTLLTPGLFVDVNSGEGAGVIRGLQPGTYSLVYDMGTSSCKWQISAGVGAGANQLPPSSVLSRGPSGASPKVVADVRGTADQRLEAPLTADSALLYAYDCRATSAAVFGMFISDQSHDTAGLVDDTRPEGWGLLQYLPDPASKGYGTDAINVSSSGCRWHVVVGTQLQPVSPGT
jgi:hypothetical protein